MARKIVLPDLLTGGDVARLFQVNPKTVTRWATVGLIPPEAVFRTLGGHRRYYREQIEALLNEGLGNGVPD